MTHKAVRGIVYIIMFIGIAALCHYIFAVPFQKIHTRRILSQVITLSGEVYKTSESEVELKIFNNKTSLYEENMSDGEEDLLVATFNIRHGVDDNGKENLDSIIQEIKSTGAHVIALQEVDCFMPRSAFKNQAKEVAKALGYYYVYGDTINVLGIRYGNALISAYPIIEHKNIKLPSSSLESRGLLKARIDVNGTIYNVFTTHLGLNNREREKQISFINKQLETEKGKIIFMGDFNSNPENEDMKGISPMLMDTAEIIDKDQVNTYAFYSDKPNTRIDRIYVSGDILIKDHQTIASKISDHSMVLINIDRKMAAEGGIAMEMPKFINVS